MLDVLLGNSPSPPFPYLNLSYLALDGRRWQNAGFPRLRPGALPSLDNYLFLTAITRQVGRGTAG